MGWRRQRSQPLPLPRCDTQNKKKTPQSATYKQAKNHHHHHATGRKFNDCINIFPRARAPIIQQVELQVPPAPPQLPRALLLGEGEAAAPLADGEIASGQTLEIRGYSSSVSFRSGSRGEIKRGGGGTKEGKKGGEKRGIFGAPRTLRG